MPTTRFERLILGTNLSGTDGGDGSITIDATAGGVTAVGADVTHNANQSIAHATATILAFNTEVSDPDGFHDPGDNSKLTIPTGMDGLYVIMGGIFWNNTAPVGYRELSIYKNGTTRISVNGFNPTSTYGATLQVVAPVLVAAADYFQLRVYQENSSSAALDVLTTTGPWFRLIGLV